ncbi:MAG: DUF4249 domain-containing protein [Prolixibacteraceae bacterium]|nr:DUF4249 domain-containing protein [Prolixibacteraceae bacterium]
MKLKYIFPVFLLLLMACEKVIDVNLNDANATVVIEANLTNIPGQVEVKVTKTGSYFGNDPVQHVSNALVKLKDDVGNEFILEETESGVYSSQRIFATIGHLYRLIVEVDGQKYEATSRLNPPVVIDSLLYKYETGFAFVDEGYYVTAYFTDPPGKRNYYRVKLYKNNQYKNDITNLIVVEDRLIDGRALQIILRQRVFKEGQVAKVELISLDKGAFDFYNTFQELISTNPGSAAPANPASNFTNGALGYFSAWSSSSKSITIKKKSSARNG